MDSPSRIKERQSLLLKSAAATQNTDQAAVLSSILRSGANIHDWDTNGNTCLHIIIAAARPNQPWTVQSLVELLQAGADPSQSNHAGLSAFDVASNDTKEFGSFRRDILLQALIESGNDIQDERLLMTTDLTESYTALHHALICGDALASTTFHLRQTLINRLANAVESRGIPSYSKLYDIAVDRVLSAYPADGSVDSNLAFNHAHNYLHRMIGLKKQICLMFNEKLPSDTRTAVEKIVNVHEISLTTVQGFDWLQPVDPENLFSSYIRNVIQQLRGSDAGGKQGQDPRRLIEALERTVARPQKRRSRQLEVRTSPVNSISEPNIRILQDEPNEDVFGNQGPSKPPRPRKQSILETPIGFYPGRREESASRLPQLGVTSNDQADDSTTGGTEEASLRKKSMAKTPIQFYRRGGPNDDNSPFNSTGRL